MSRTDLPSDAAPLSMSGWIAVSFVLGMLVVALGMGTVSAVPLSVFVDEPDAVSPGEGTDVTFEITNDGDEPSSALGLELRSVPEDVSVDAIESPEGTIAPDQHAVFWIEPVDPGESVTVTYELAVDADAQAEDRSLESEISSGSVSMTETMTLPVTEEPGTDDTDDDDRPTDETEPTDTGPLPDLSLEQLVLGTLLAAAVIFVISRVLTGEQ